MIKAILIIITILILAMNGHANEYIASSCSRAHVDSVVSLASDGDTVTVPAGTCTWDSSIVINNIGILFRGAGIGQTIIKDSTAATWTQKAITATTQNGDTLRITGFTFQYAWGSHDYQGVIHILGSSKAVRLDHLRFDSLWRSPDGQGAITINDCDIYGVMDNCVFEDDTAFYGVHLKGMGNADDSLSWMRSLSLGTDSAFFMEDNEFNFSYHKEGYGAAIDGAGGTRYVFRYNDVSTCMIAAHDQCGGGGTRGCFSWEIYENTITQKYHNVNNIVLLRAGTGVIYNNVFDTTNGGSAYDYIRLLHDRTCENDAFDKCSGKWGNRCDGGDDTDTSIVVDGNQAQEAGSHNGASNLADSLFDTGQSWSANEWRHWWIYNTTDGSKGKITTNNDTITVVDSLYGGTDNDWDSGDSYEITNGWPCVDQLGRSTGTFGSQDSMPAFEWGNTIDGGDVDMETSDAVCDSPTVSDHVMENRDYFNDTEKSGYTAFTYPHPLRGETVSSTSQVIIIK